MSEPLVSIVIPCYNAARWVAQTLESALSQSWRHTEIIFVNDGSRDHSLDIARDYAHRHKLTILDRPNAGAAAARNAGLRASRGDFIQFLDADDLLHPHKIARQLQCATQPSTPANAVFNGRWARFVGDISASHFRDDNPLFADLAPREFFLRYAGHDCMMHPAAWLLPRAVCEAAGPWDEHLSLNDDGEYFARIVAASSQVLYCPDALSYYRSGLAGNLASQRSRRHLESAHLAALTLAEHLLRFEDSAAMRTAAANLLQRFAYDYYPSAPDLVVDAERRARAIGRPTFAPLGGRFFQLSRHVVGWKCSRHLQRLVHSRSRAAR